MKKSPDAFRTISEVADVLDVQQHVLRFWETKFPQIKPLKRAGGRRYYRPEDVDLLRGIRALLYTEGYTIKGVQKVIREQGVRIVTEHGRGLAANGAEPAVRVALTQAPSLPAAASLTQAPKTARGKDGAGARGAGELEAVLAQLLEAKALLGRRPGAGKMAPGRQSPPAQSRNA